MTDNEIIKALECCVQGYCRGCAFDDGANFNCKDNVMESAFNLINNKNEEIERYKGVIKILENDVKVANIEAVKNFAHFLIDRSKGGKIEVVDVADLAVEYMNTFGGNKDEQ